MPSFIPQRMGGDYKFHLEPDVTSAYKEIVGYFMGKIGKCFESLEFPFKFDKLKFIFICENMYRVSQKSS